MSDLVSVIVPVYNVRKYLEECVNSILNQDYQNIEIVLVDDGSTDGSSELCDHIKLKDERISVYHKKNGGLSDARNFGIKKSKGNIIVFTDSDDVVCSNMITRLYNDLTDNGADISIVDITHFYNEEEPIFEHIKETNIIQPEAALCDMLYQKNFLVSACGKMFKKELFKSILFPKNMLYEDSAIMYKLIDNSKTITYNKSKLYGYRHRGKSITTSSFSKRNLDIITISDEIVEYFSTRSENLVKASRAYRLNSHFRIFLTIPNTEEYKKYRIKSEDYIKKNCKAILKDKNIRSKMRIAIYCYIFFKPILKLIYSKVDRWK